jgi:hypothetical protein
MKSSFYILIFTLSFYLQAQTSILINDQKGVVVKEPKKIDKQSLLELSTNKTILCYTFSLACQPCILHLKNAIKLSEDYNKELYILLFNKTGKYKRYAIEYLTQIKKDIPILTIDDSYGKSNRKSYKKFLTDITPKSFKNIPDFSKYIVLKNKKVLMITNYKDSEINPDWKDDMPMLKQKVIPLLN